MMRKHDPEVVEKVLTLLRRWGWETGYKKLQAELRAVEDPIGCEVREFFLGWIAAERGGFEQAEAHFQAMAHLAALSGWALLGQAFVALRQKEFRLARQLLHQVVEKSNNDKILEATVAHLRGTFAYNEGKSQDAHQLLCEALNGFGDDHFGSGRVFDTLGMIYASRNSFHAAREFFARAIQCKDRQGDETGLALSHGQLGRLYIDWGIWDKAEHHFQEDLHISQRIDDERGQAQMYNFLGQLALARGEEEAAACRQAAARQQWKTANGWLDASIRRSQDRWATLEGYARKDRVLVHLAEANFAEAEDQAQTAEKLFQRLQFEEGLAHVNRVRGVLRRNEGRFLEAMVALRAALRHFDRTGELSEVARTQWEIARACRDAGEPQPLVSQAFRDALNQAQACRRSKLVRRIEEELRVVDSEAYHKHVFHRVRGRAVSEDTSSLMTGNFEPATVLYLDLKGSTEYTRNLDPAEVMLTLNQMMADLVSVLRKQDALVSAFRGDGFLALLRGENHALRAVGTALDLLQAIVQFIERRALLKLLPITARIGIASGEVFMGNVGTYDKMDFTAIGTTANLGARVEALAEPGLPCISRGTYELVRDRFTYAEGSPRTVELKGLGEQEVWDVTGRAERGTAAPSSASGG